jgi:hypothetical protein
VILDALAAETIAEFDFKRLAKNTGPSGLGWRNNGHVDMSMASTGRKNVSIF